MTTDRHSQRRGVAALLAVALCALLSLAAAQTPDAQASVFSADLTSTNVVPPVHTAATGWVVAVLHGSTLQIDGAYGNLSSDLATNVRGGIHLHRGGPDENGAIVFELDHAGDRVGTFSGSFDLDQDQIQALQDGMFYIQIHSRSHPQGEIRGQLTPFTPSGNALSAGGK